MFGIQLHSVKYKQRYQINILQNLGRNIRQRIANINLHARPYEKEAADVFFYLHFLSAKNTTEYDDCSTPSICAGQYGCPLTFANTISPL